LPRTRAGKLDRAHLPLPTARDGADVGLKGGRTRSLKGGMPTGGSGVSAGCLWFICSCILVVILVPLVIIAL
jgi:hypothetical protein